MDPHNNRPHQKLILSLYNNIRQQTIPVYIRSSARIGALPQLL